MNRLNEERKVKRMEKRIAKLEMALEISIDSRLSYLETTVTNLKHVSKGIDDLSDLVDKANGEIKNITEMLKPKQQIEHTKFGIEVA